MKRLQILLVMMGTIAMIAGGLIMVSSVTVAAPTNQSEDTSRGNIVYVGTDTCFTCHSDFPRDGWHALHPQAIQNPVANPQVVLADLSAAQAVRQINTGSETRAYTVGDGTNTMSSGPTQRYVMKTEDGDAVLPGTWVMPEENADEAESMDWVDNCSGCHGPAGKHIRLARQLEPDANADELNTVRQAIVTTTHPVICDDCQVGENRPNLDNYQTGVSLPEMTSAGGGKTAKQHFLLLQATLWDSPTAHPIYRRETPIR